MPNRLPFSAVHPHRAQRGVSLVEAMVSLTLFALVTLGFIGTFLQSRRLSEATVMHAAASSMVYGIIEQIKGLEYNTALPSTVNDVNPDNPAEVWGQAPFVRVRINQDQTAWLRVVYTRPPNAPRGPHSIPTTKPSEAIDNELGAIPLTMVDGASSQALPLNLWIWIDELEPQGNATEVKKVTIIYSYKFLDGRKERLVRDREVFLRTRFDQ